MIVRQAMNAARNARKRSHHEAPVITRRKLQVVVGRRHAVVQTPAYAVEYLVLVRGTQRVKLFHSLLKRCGSRCRR